MKHAHHPLKNRAAQAILLTVGFYTLALVVVAILLFVAYFNVASGHASYELTAFCLFGASTIVWSSFPHPRKFQAPGPVLEPDEHPALFAVISDLAEKTGQPVPDEIYLMGDVNAFVGEFNGWFGSRKRRILGIGMPLFQLLTVDQLRAVLAHEFGHYHRGDSWLVPLVYRTRETVLQTVRNLDQRSTRLQILFYWYARQYLKVSNAVSRQQELAADILAARLTGVNTSAGALKTIGQTAFAFDCYMNRDVWPMLAAGLRPPILQGFQQYLRAAPVRNMIQDIETQVLQAEAVTDPYDTHPCLRERLDVLSSLPEGKGTSAGGELRAVTLLSCTEEEMEKALLAHFLPPEIYQDLRAVDWEKSTEQYLIPAWERNVVDFRRTLEGVPVGGLAQMFQPPSPFIKTIQQLSSQPVPREQSLILAANLCGQVLGLALVRHGWTVYAPLGCQVSLGLGEHQLELMQTMHELANQQLSPEQWIVLCDKFGITETPLVSDSSPLAAASSPIHSH